MKRTQTSPASFEPTFKLTIKQICLRFHVEEWKVKVWIREGKIIACGTRPSLKGGAPVKVYHEADVLKVVQGGQAVDGRKERVKEHDALMKELEQESQQESLRYEKWLVSFQHKLEGSDKKR